MYVPTYVGVKASIKFSQASYLRLHSEMILLKYHNNYYANKTQDPF